VGRLMEGWEPQERPSISASMSGEQPPERKASDAGFMRAVFGDRRPKDRHHPVPVRVGARYRPLQTGGGLLCPGRQEPRHRAKPNLTGIYNLVKAEIGMAYIDNYFNPESTGTTTLISALRAGALTGFTWGKLKGVCPFPPEQIHRIRSQVSQQQLRKGYPHEMAIVPRQPFYLSLIASLASRNRDSEAIFPREIHLQGGVHLGVTEELPSVEPHYPSDKHPPDPDLEPPINPDLGNYASHKQNVEDILRTYEEEKELGMTAGPYSPSEAKEFLKGKAPIFLPLGARPEKDKIRSIQDGSAPGTNHRIREHCLTRIPLPGIQDSRQINAIAQRDGIPVAMLQLDYSKAHRRIPIL
jgi:hypothetical protein